MKNEIRIIGGTDEFEQFVKQCIPEDISLVRCRTMKEAVERSSAQCRAYLIMPDYKAGATRVPELEFEILKKFAALKKVGQHLFVENYNAGDYTHRGVFGHMIDSGIRHIFTENIVANESLVKDLPGGNILQARGSYYFPGRSRNYLYSDKQILLEATDCIGTNTVVKEGGFSFPVLMQTGNYFCSAMNMTQFDYQKMLPVCRWKALYAKLFSQVLGISEDDVSEAFERVWQPIATVGAVTAPKKDALENAVGRAIDWHGNSGLMLSSDGKSGIYEMIRSNDLKVRSNIRMDSDLITGLLFYIAGKRNGDEELAATGENLIHFLLDSGIQIEEGEFEGLFKWFIDLDEGPFSIWSSDAGRGGLVMINMYQLTGEDEYLDRARRLGDAVLKWFGPFDLLSGSLGRPEKTYSYHQTEEKISDNPVYYGEMASFLLQLYKTTKEDKYKDAVLKFAGKIMDAFPDTKPFGFSDNFSYSRYLVMISVMQEILNMDISREINNTLKFFKSLQHECGGLGEAPIKLAMGDVEAGVGIGDGSDNIADMLYCNNFVLCALSVITKMKNPYSVDVALAGKIYKNLTDFLLRIQISDTDKRLNGGWMRAFDMDHNEYYGLNKDKDWGAYCIMAGWMTGFIPLVFLNELGEQSVFVN